MNVAKDGICLYELLSIVIPVCKEAEQNCPKTGPGRKPEIPDWLIATLIMLVTVKKKKTKSAQYRWIKSNEQMLKPHLEGHRMPSRSTYFDRFRRAHLILTEAVRCMGNRAIRYGWADASVVAVDKSLMWAKGPIWWKSDRDKNRIPPRLPGVDRDSRWGFSQYHGAIQGYCFEVVVSCGKNGVIWPLQASVGTANTSEHKSFGSKIQHLPNTTKFVLADAGYDNNRFGDEIEWTNGKRTGKRFLCPQNSRGAKSSTPVPKRPNESWRIYGIRMRRHERRKYFKTDKAKRTFRLRSKSVEPFNEWLKSTFEFNTNVWHRGLDNNKTQVLAAFFTYQVLLRYNQSKGRKNGRIRSTLDSL